MRASLGSWGCTALVVAARQAKAGELIQVGDSERQLRALLRNSSDMITVVAADASVMYQTGAVRSVLGREPDQLEGRNLADWVDPEDVALLLELCQTVESAAAELRLRHVDGSERVCEVRATGLFDEAAWWGAVLNIHDISERKRLELELRLAQKLESVGQLAAGIAHEINTPVQFISSSVQFVKNSFRDVSELLEAIDGQLRDAAQRGAMEPELLTRVAEAREAADLEYLLERVPQALARSLDGLDRVATIVAAMRTFARAPTTLIEPVDLNEAIKNTLVVAANEYRHVADVTCDFGDIPLVNGNAGGLNQVMLNLIVNASHAIADVVGDSGKHGTIHIRTSAEPNEIAITIADSGGGIAAQIAQRVFDPFFTTKEVGRGSGQGLAISRTIIDGHRGELTFESDPGNGTTFTIRLPSPPPSPTAIRWPPPPDSD
jgi:PAS domain S-box-containing protein